MQDAILTLNAGSSSLKYALYPRVENATHSTLPVSLSSGCIDELGTEENTHLAALHELLDSVAAKAQVHIVAVGHRIVHGGPEYAAPILLDAPHIAALEKLIPLAPLHQPHNLAGIAAVSKLMPGVAQVACFDTAFHHSQPAVAQRYGLPRYLHDAGVRSYGFHGLSYESVVARLPEHLGPLAMGRIIIAHLGNGASLCATKEGQSVATTMGFSTLDGLLMGTRAGHLDPGVLLYLMQHEGMNLDTLSRLLYKESGLLGVSSLSADMRTLQGSESPAAKEAIDLFCYRIQREIGSLAAALGGVEAIIFTGGIGEHASEIRARICSTLAWLGSPQVLTLPADEEGIIASHTRRLIQS